MLIAQISDLHVALDPIAAGLDTLARAQAAVAALQQVDPRPDCLVITGDLTEHGRAEEYEALWSALSVLRMPILAVPGNHDQRRTFRAAFASTIPYAGSNRLDFSVEVGGVKIIGLDTLNEGFSHGTLTEESLAFAAEALARKPGLPTLIMCHHPPARCGIPLFDDIGLLDGREELQALVRGHGSVARILCGHLHRTIVASFAGTVVQIAPSVSHGLSTEGGMLRINREPPAYLLHDVSDAGMVSHLRYVDRCAAQMAL